MARPASFDREQVLGSATAAFWEHGYAATSISHLVDATQLQPGSLYAAFGSKEGLFLAVLDHYARQSLARLRAVLAEASDPLQGIHAFFERLASDSSDVQRRRGCLLVNTALEVGRNNVTVRERVREHLAQIEQVLQTAIEDAQQQGLLTADRSPVSLAKYLMTTILGLRVMAGTGEEKDSALLVVRQALSVLSA